MNSSLIIMSGIDYIDRNEARKSLLINLFVYLISCAQFSSNPITLGLDEKQVYHLVSMSFYWNKLYHKKPNPNRIRWACRPAHCHTLLARRSLPHWMSTRRWAWFGCSAPPCGLAPPPTPPLSLSICSETNRECFRHTLQRYSGKNICSIVKHVNNYYMVRINIDDGNKPNGVGFSSSDSRIDLVECAFTDSHIVVYRLHFNQSASWIIFFSAFLWPLCIIASDLISYVR